MCVCVGVYSKNPVSYGRTLFYRRAFYCSQYNHPAKVLPMVVMLCSYPYVLNYLGVLADNCICYVQLAITFTLNFGLSSYNYSYLF